MDPAGCPGHQYGAAFRRRLFGSPVHRARSPLRDGRDRTSQGDHPGRGRRAGVTHGLVIRHFGSKERLFVAAVPSSGDLMAEIAGDSGSLPTRVCPEGGRPSAPVDGTPTPPYPADDRRSHGQAGTYVVRLHSPGRPWAGGGHRKSTP
ncbi:TetR/AcrR family transcriptional regulator [Streptomyces sp. Ru62]|uniref:TetR/AcrR family transcriptional regulator n=1 Tax=Streptomyces sp. Ru62 TaxID=2080745 RepID=UPI0035BC9776